MESLYKKLRDLNLDTSFIGLAFEDNSDYFCTPRGAHILGWDNGVHYCQIDGFGEMVFAVDPMTLCDYYVFPIAENFDDFLRLIVTVGSTNTLLQIVNWNKGQYDEFRASEEETEYRNSEDVTKVIETIKSELGVNEMPEPFEYVKSIQKDFDYDSIPFSEEYYLTLH